MFYALEILEVVRCVLLCMLAVVERELNLLEVLEVPEVMCRVVAPYARAVRGGLSFWRPLKCPAE